MSSIINSWFSLYGFRKKLRGRYPNFWRIKIIKKPFDAVRPFLKEDIRVLDIGSGDRKMGEKIKNIFPGSTYKSMDIDREKYHDYYSLDDIRESFDIILLFEVIEHLEFNEAVNMLKRIKELLVPGGRFIITTPNVYHPNRYWEYSHKISYRYDELGGLLLALGYTIERVFRVYNDAIIQRMIRIYLMSPIHHYFSIDFARSIVVVAGK